MLNNSIVYVPDVMFVSMIPPVEAMNWKDEQTCFLGCY